MRRYVRSAIRQLLVPLLSPRELDEKELTYRVNLIYQHVLGREADRDGLRSWISALSSGMRLSQVVKQIEASDEARQRRSGRAPDDISDGEFILNAADVLFESRGATPREIEYYRRILREDRAKRNELVLSLIGAHVARQRKEREVA